MRMRISHTLSVLEVSGLTGGALVTKEEAADAPT